VCHLLGLQSDRELSRSPFLGAIFEGFVASEIVKRQIGSGRARELYYFRDQQGLESTSWFHAGTVGSSS
jgi:predicted AAA+ superfamily ATPase